MSARETAGAGLMPNWWIDANAKHKPEGHTCGRCGTRIGESYSFHADLPDERFCSRVQPPAYRPRVARGGSMSPEPTLNEALAARGFTTADAPGLYHKDILSGETVVFTGTAGDVWQWLGHHVSPEVKR